MPLHKATRDEKPEHLTNGYSPVLIACRRKFARWAADLQELPAVTLPPALFNRAGDNWLGLFSIAEAAGGEWPERAKQAAMEGISEEDSNSPCSCWRPIWQIFAEKKVVRMHTTVLLEALMKVEEAPWEDGEQRPRNRRLLVAGKAQGVPAAARESRGGGGTATLPRMAGRERPRPQGLHGGPSARSLVALPRAEDAERDRQNNRLTSVNSDAAAITSPMTEAVARKHASGGPAKRRTSPNGGAE